jgi:ankyrin repeat protein
MYGTALQAASLAGNLDIISVLLDSGANPNVQGEIICSFENFTFS